MFFFAAKKKQKKKKHIDGVIIKILKGAKPRLRFGHFHELVFYKAELIM